MKVILKEAVKGLGKLGDVVDVKPGYARNYLFPKLLAIVADAAGLAWLESERKNLDIKAKEIENISSELKNKLGGISLVIEALAKESGELYGAISISDIIANFASLSLDIGKDMIAIPKEGIKTVGDHKISIHFKDGSFMDLSLTVVAKTEG